jgi:thioredoxin-dependent peroxiredoxin
MPVLGSASTLQTRGTGPHAFNVAWLASKKGMAQTAAQPAYSATKELVMKRLMILALGSAVFAAPLYAALQTGVQAPDFTTQATLAGKPFKFALADALKSGPVVLYFYPAAFTPGCTVEAHDFAEATDKFKALGATVIGVSHDPIDKLNKFSVSECRNKFAVASDADQSITKAYDAVLAVKPEYANRTSYVIAPTGKIIYEYTAMNPDKHVENTMAAVEKWKAENKGS